MAILCVRCAYEDGTGSDDFAQVLTRTHAEKKKKEESTFTLSRPEVQLMLLLDYKQSEITTELRPLNKEKKRKRENKTPRNENKIHQHMYFV